MLKHQKQYGHKPAIHQPPSGGCVLKRATHEAIILLLAQPPSGGCVLKLAKKLVNVPLAAQPPSGGCVLKRQSLSCASSAPCGQPPSGGCVLKRQQIDQVVTGFVPAAFGRLCVETKSVTERIDKRNPAAFGRLCVETNMRKTKDNRKDTSRLRAAVC